MRFLTILALVGAVFFAPFAAEAAIKREPGYPAHWWEPVPRDSAPDWEILPQDAGPGEVILSKRNELGLLSNFADTPIRFRGKRYASIEGFWQMMKYPEGPADPRATFPGIEWPFTRDQVAAMTGFEAKEAGKIAGRNMKKMGIKWLTFDGKRLHYKGRDKQKHYRIIKAISEAKVEQNRNVRDVLLATGDLELRPDHKQGPNPPPAYRYYDIYMDIRSDLQQQNKTASR